MQVSLIKIVFCYMIDSQHQTWNCCTYNSSSCNIFTDYKCLNWVVIYHSIILIWKITPNVRIKLEECKVFMGPECFCKHYPTLGFLAYTGFFKCFGFKQIHTPPMCSSFYSLFIFYILNIIWVTKVTTVALFVTRR